MTASLLNTYIVAGPYYPKTSQPIADGGLELVASHYFTTVGKKDHTLLVTDECGVLRSVNAVMEPAAQPKQHPPFQPMSLYLIPTGAVKACFFGNAKSWQSDLVSEINEFISDQNANLQPLTTTPITFGKNQLKKPDDPDALTAFNNEFKDGEIYNGQLIWKNRLAIIAVPSRVFATNSGAGKGSEPNQQSPDQNAGKSKSSVSIFDNKGKKVPLLAIADEKEIEYESELNAKKTTGKYRIFCLSTMDTPIAEGKYVVSIPLGICNKGIQTWGKNNGIQSLSFSIDIKFSINSLNGDFDFHVLGPISIEEALMSQFPEKFETIKQKIISAESTDSKPESKEKAFDTWKEKYEAGREKSKLISENVESASMRRFSVICAKVLGGVTSYYKQQQNPEAKKVAQLFEDNFYAVFSGVAAYKKWDEFFIKQKNKLKEATTAVEVTGKWLSQRFVSTPIMKYVYDTAKYKNNTLRRLDALDIRRLKTDPGYSAKAKRLILFDGLTEKDMTMSKVFGKVAGKALSVMDTAVSIYSIAALIKDRTEAKEKKELYKGRLTDGAKNYSKKFGNNPSLIGIARLEALRKLADTAAADLSDKDRELISASIDAAINLAVYIPIPVVQEAAGLIILGKEALGASGAVLQVIARDIDKIFLDSMLQDFNEKRERLDLLEKEYVATIKALQEKKNTSADPEVQFRVRAAILIGLIRLIERCGSRYDKDNDKIKFEDKVKQYNIDGYIKAFIHNPSSKAAYLSLVTEIPIDEQWLFCHGNKADYGIITAQRVYKIVADNWYALPLVLVAPEAAATGAALKITTAGNVPVKFQRQFPIHCKDSDATLDLARALCTNYSGIKEADFEFARIYARKSGGTWEPVESFVQNTGNPRITPYTEIRVVVVLKGDNLAGLPLSLQLFREHFLYSTGGPVYKGMALRLTESDKNEGNDKGLLRTTDEEKYISSSNTSYYGFVFHPFYYFGNVIIKGIKPCAFIGIEKDPTIKMKFKIGAGEKPSYDVATGPSKKSTIGVTLFTHEPSFLAMAWDKAFLENKTAKPVVYPAFSSDVKSDPTYCGAFLKKNKTWYYYNKYDANYENLQSGNDFNFSWCDQFEIIFIFSALTTTKQWFEAEEMRFPALATTYEYGRAYDDKGPSYDVEVACLSKQRPFTSKVLPTHEVVAGMMYDTGIAKKGEEHVQWSSTASKSMLSHHQDFLVLDTNYLFACRTGFRYSVSDENGIERVYNRLKPFGSDFIQEGKGHYKLGIRLSSPEYGLPELKGPYLQLPGLPDASKFGFPINEKFVTKDILKKELKIERTDFE
jgi:hypothetical protein